MIKRKNTKNKLYLLPSFFLATALIFGQYKPTVPDSEKNSASSVLEQQILQETAKAQTVMFGEMHSLPQKENPYFKIVIPLLPKLKEQGFNYFAVEVPRKHQDLVDKVASNTLNREEYVNEICNREQISKEMLLSEGFYSVINSAGENGMKVVAYDTSWEEDATIRDSGQFRNLKGSIFNKYPNSRVVIYCGEMHVGEESYFAIVCTEEIKEDKIILDVINKEVFPLGSFLSKYTKDKNFSLDMVNVNNSADAKIIRGKLKR